MNNELLFKELYKKSLRYLGIRLRTEKELRTKLKEWIKKDFTFEDENQNKEVEEVVGKVISQLTKVRFLDDRRFATEWVEGRVRNKPRGEVLLRMELVQKGVPRGLIDEVLTEVLHKNPQESSENAMFDMALRMGKKYLPRLKNEDERACKFKLRQALARKGFNSQVISRVVDDLISSRYNTEQ